MMASAPIWKKFLQAQLQANIEKQGMSATYVSLATVRSDNTPANRTMVFRGFSGEDHREKTGWESDLLTFTTDMRSRKLGELAVNPMVELNWWMSGTEEQFRVYGKAYRIDKDTSTVRGLNQEDHFARVREPSESETSDLATLAFLRYQRGKGKETCRPFVFDWQAERLRQWIRMSPALRATFVPNCPAKELIISQINPETGWFVSDNQQELLEIGYANFVLLLVDVVRIDHVMLVSGKHSMYYKDDKTSQWALRHFN
ncbi:pyridoxamine 5'-phosphate oxidase-domain-containing protein [Dichotomocladium elegans]|nr:pyridoxamine 5'-phosphate oxidase-domain-containing protein [Dichotomocladium elegans]